MEAFGFAEMQQFQRELQEKYFDLWGGLGPEVSIRTTLWMIGEICEAADVLKKQGTAAILNDPETRRHFIEELTDAMMYFNDLCLCLSIRPEELVEVYREKHARNMTRWERKNEA